ncbi:transcriptional regulator, LacI family [Rathayibacter oskolensis]|uniref:Transcriptional regulator, LacI family n=1 Tax=Rathayibacter oskolensis TaxID=1891671 RepID=A0A1X7PG95_9MICO|nr:LacI family DNA-binding transcriptional regulator [Rathayibacter oskolensis]SMH50427.1 transcriptional regulator, LacI family [Rathayibacter oskolensis]
MSALETSQRQPSLHDIAKESGVSVSTVSRYVNGQLTLKPDTESRVLAAMERLGYSAPPRPASRTRATRTGAIGLVVPSVGNAYFGRIAESIVTAAESHGLAVLTASTHSHARKENEYVAMLAERSVDALIYAGNHTSNSSLSSLITSGLPVVVIDEALLDGPPVDTVLVDDYAGAYQAVAHLASMGHERIAMVSGPTRLRSVGERRRGFHDALRRAGLDPEDQVILSGPFSEDFGVGALSRLLSAPKPPTAVFAASDVIALGLMTGAANLGVAIPRELSLVGFDDIPAAGYVSPRLTTVRMPPERMAAAAIAMVIERLEGVARSEQQSVVPVALVVRETVAPPRA